MVGAGIQIQTANSRPELIGFIFLRVPCFIVFVGGPFSDGFRVCNLLFVAASSLALAFVLGCPFALPLCFGSVSLFLFVAGGLLFHFLSVSDQLSFSRFGCLV